MPEHRSRARMALIALSACALTGSVASGARAADSGPATGPRERSPAAAAVIACRDLSGSARRLACFMAASAALAAEQGPAPPTETARTQSAPPAAGPSPPPPFGARAPKPPRAVKPRPIRQVTMKLISFSDPGDGRVVFAFDDGSTWREIEPASVAGALKPGESVVLERGLLGSTLLDIPGRASVKVSRTGPAP